MIEPLKKFVAASLSFFSSLVEEHKFFRRVALVWAMVLITWTTYYTFVETPNIPTSTAAALSAVIGILTVVVGFYIKKRSDEDDK